jgi:hypothetical protein
MEFFVRKSLPEIMFKKKNSWGFPKLSHHPISTVNPVLSTPRADPVMAGKKPAMVG